MAKFPGDPVARFWGKVDKSSDCWLWTGMKGKSGYGRFRLPQGEIRAHRMSWELSNGRKVPSGMLVCHRCDNPGCVNPRHLFLGTSYDNQLDSVKKGRTAGGEKNGRAKLTSRLVQEIRTRYGKSGISLRSLAGAYGVDHTTIHAIVRKENWR